MSDINFSKLTWENLPARTTALSATNLNRIENGIADSVDGVNANSHSIAELQTRISQIANGSPTPVATVAEMTDKSAVYLYTGSETGYTAGNWYYYNGTAWTSGGTYGGATTSTTFNQPGVPADDFAVGEALALKADDTDLTALDTRVTAVEGDVDALGGTINVDFYGIAGSDILLSQSVKNTGTAAGVWIWDAIEPTNTEFDVVLLRTSNVDSGINYIRVQFQYSDSTESNVYIKEIGVPIRAKATEGKTIADINFLFARASAAVSTDVTSQWDVIAYSGNRIADSENELNVQKNELSVLKIDNDVQVLLNKKYSQYAGSSTWWVSGEMPAVQNPFYAMITEVDGLDSSLTYYVRIICYYTDNTESSTYIRQVNTPVLVTPTAGKTVASISLVFSRSSATVSTRRSTWNFIAYTGNKIGDIEPKVDALTDEVAIISKKGDKYEQIYQELVKKMPYDDGTSMFNSAISLGHDVMKTDERAIIIEINPEYIIGRVYIWENAPQTDVRYSYLYNWTQGSWYRAYVAPNTYFSVVFRNPTQTAGLTLETVMEHSRIMYYDDYARAYVDNAINAFETKITSDMSDYPIMFGVISDVHYPTGNDLFAYTLYRNAIKNGCKALRRIASDLNSFFITNLGDDAGYSTADNNESNIIKGMTTVDGLLRGGVHVLPVNGNHEAFQNHEYMNPTDFYRARIVNLDGVTKVSNIATNYYFDDEYFKIRFVFFDTETYHRTDYTNAIAGAELLSMFSTAPNDYSFILFCHKDIGADADFPQSTDFHSYITEYIPRLLFQCSGHTHKDGYYESNGIRDINFIAAGYYNYTGLTQEGQWGISDKESSFAIVGVNPTTMQVKVFGYGMATDRTFDFSS